MGLSSYPEIGVIHITGNPESFDDVSNWWYTTKQKMIDQGIFDKIYKSAADSAYSCGDVSVPGLRHFIFKSKANVQITCPTYDDIYAQDMHARQRLLNSYDELYNRVHSTNPESSIPQIRSIESFRSPNEISNNRDSTFTDRNSVIGSGDGFVQDSVYTATNESTKQTILASSAASTSSTQQQDEDKRSNECSEEATQIRQEEQKYDNYDAGNGRPEEQTHEQSNDNNESNDNNHAIPTSSNNQNSHDNMKDTEPTPPNRPANKSMSQQFLKATISSPANMLKATTSMMSYMPSLPQLGQRRIDQTSQTPQHHKIQQSRPRNNQRVSYFIKNEHESVLVWSTRIFELYIALPASMPHSAAVNSAQSLVKWIRKEEQSLFLGNTPTF